MYTSAQRARQSCLGTIFHLRRCRCPDRVPDDLLGEKPHHGPQHGARDVYGRLLSLPCLFREDVLLASVAVPVSVGANPDILIAGRTCRRGGRYEGTTIALSASHEHRHHMHVNTSQDSLCTRVPKRRP